MSRFSKLACVALIGALGATSALAAGKGATPVANPAFEGLGRTATPAEIRAWDIDVRPDFKGLPKGQGSVEQGQDVWEAKCATCHGTFGESNEVFTPIVGGTTADDIKTGHVKNLQPGSSFPQRTTLMKVATLSTLWDYINRAMPWTAPKSLKTDEVYAVLAYILNLGEIVPADFVLSDANIAEVQKRMPNRNGMTTDHGLWPGKGIGTGKPDVKAVACMTNCKSEVKIGSTLPDYAETAHGNLAEQNRTIGATRGKDINAAKGQPAAAADKPSANAQAHQLAQTAGCTACHGLANKVVGPGFNEVAAKYKGKADAEGKLVAKVKQGGAGVWGQIPMPPQSLKDEEIKSLVQWILSGAPAK